MCGRFFVVHTPDALAQAFGATLGETVAQMVASPSYNVAPGQPVLVVRYDRRHARRSLDALRWGLIPHFAKDASGAYRCINARAETVDTRPSYRAAFEKRRCLFAVDGFFEWRSEGKTKQPYAIALKTREPFGIAGVWENWKDPNSGEWLRTCALITTEANELVAPVHGRMPAIVRAEDHARWLGEVPATPAELKAMLQPFDPHKMDMWPVSTRVNTPKNDDPSLIEPTTGSPSTG
ncbi:MAG: SOS response-associated peptidase [Myxococcales bacterium]|nr:SOS response-associated peptidase [Myxococcales bacterium]